MSDLKRRQFMTLLLGDSMFIVVEDGIELSVDIT
jgi:hypothetical protein